MKHSYRQPALALVFVVVAAIVVAACGQVTPGEEAQAPEGLRATQAPTSRLLQDKVCVDGDPACGPTGAHAKHASHACTVCHKYAGTLSFDKNGPAYGTGQVPTYDATAKTCSNVACHGVPAGIFTYFTPAGDQVDVPYGGNGGPSPSWYSTGLGCTVCHDLTYKGTTYSWHMPNHGAPFVVAYTCQTCHLDATGTNGFPSTWVRNTATNCPPLAPTGTTACAAYHANGTLDMTPLWKSKCFSCHQ